jgi:hypothetical protein
VNPLGSPNLVTRMVSPDKSLRKLNPGRKIVWLDEDPRRRPTPVTGITSLDESLLRRLTLMTGMVSPNESLRKLNLVKRIVSPDAIGGHYSIGKF